VAAIVASVLVLLVALNVVYSIQEKATISYVYRNIVPGITRKQAYRLLAERQLVATNGDYLLNHRTETGCEIDYSSMNWPYRNEQWPFTVHNGCIQADWSPEDGHEPRAEVDIAGSYALLIMCQHTTMITISFDADDLVQNLTTQDLGADCA